MNSTLISLSVILSISLVGWGLAAFVRWIAPKMGIAANRHPIANVTIWKKIT
jgi:hypothetical protein